MQKKLTSREVSRLQSSASLCGTRSAIPSSECPLLVYGRPAYLIHLVVSSPLSTTTLFLSIPYQTAFLSCFTSQHFFPDSSSHITTSTEAPQRIFAFWKAALFVYYMARRWLLYIKFALRLEHYRKLLLFHPPRRAYSLLLEHSSLFDYTNIAVHHILFSR